MANKCHKCGLVNFQTATICARCQGSLAESENIPPGKLFSKWKALKRIGVFLLASFFAIGGFYISLLVSAKRITPEQTKTVGKAIDLLDKRGFSSEAFYLKHLTAFRATDNWLNASVEKENAYAATNFPFEIMTLYFEFFVVPLDDTERAAILLHEAKHLQGKDEKGAYEFVWKNRKQLGWTSDKYGGSEIWQTVRNQTKDYAPGLFVCENMRGGDCTE